MSMIEWNPTDLDLPLCTAPTEILVRADRDLFLRDETIEKSAAILAVMAATQHRYTVCVQSPAGALAWFQRLATHCKYANGGRGTSELGLCLYHAQRQSAHPALRMAAEIFAKPWPLTNLAIGVTISDQPSADTVLPIVAQIPAHRRIVRATLRGPVDLSLCSVCGGSGEIDAPGDMDRTCPGCDGDGSFLSWVSQVIISAEDGADATPVEIGWLTKLARQVLDAQTMIIEENPDTMEGGGVCTGFTGPSLSIEQWPVCSYCAGLPKGTTEPVGGPGTSGRSWICHTCRTGQSRATMTKVRSDDKYPPIYIPGHGTQRYSQGIRWQDGR